MEIADFVNAAKQSEKLVNSLVEIKAQNEAIVNNVATLSDDVLTVDGTLDTVLKVVNHITVCVNDLATRLELTIKEVSNLVMENREDHKALYDGIVICMEGMAILSRNTPAPNSENTYAKATQNNPEVPDFEQYCETELAKKPIPVPEPEPVKPQEWFTRQQAADYLGIHSNDMGKAVTWGMIEPYSVEGYKYAVYHRKDLDSIKPRMNRAGAAKAVNKGKGIK